MTCMIESAVNGWQALIGLATFALLWKFAMAALSIPIVPRLVSFQGSFEAGRELRVRKMSCRVRKQSCKRGAAATMQRLVCHESAPWSESGQVYLAVPDHQSELKYSLIRFAISWRLFARNPS